MAAAALVESARVRIMPSRPPTLDHWMRPVRNISETLMSFTPRWMLARCVPSATLPMRYRLLSKWRMRAVPGVSAVGVVMNWT